MPRHRVGVALLLDPPAAAEVDGLRRAAGDRAIDRIVPHVTLLSPCNVPAAALSEALRVLRAAAAAQTGSLRLTIGPPATFLPDNPVLYLAVGGDLDSLRRLTEALRRPPLDRPRPWPWVPHVTVADGVDERRAAAAVAALGSYRSPVDFDRVVLLEERRGTGSARWEALADAALGPAAVIGRGGLELTVTAGRVVGPDLRALIDLDAPAHPGEPPAPGCGAPGGGSGSRRCESGPVVLTAHREGNCVGGARAWWEDDRPWVGVYVAPQHRRSGVGAHLLATLESHLHSAGWSPPVLWGVGPARFYSGRSAWVRAAGG